MKLVSLPCRATAPGCNAAEVTRGWVLEHPTLPELRAARQSRSASPRKPSPPRGRAVRAELDRQRPAAHVWLQSEYLDEVGDILGGALLPDNEHEPLGDVSWKVSFCEIVLAWTVCGGSPWPSLLKMARGPNFGALQPSLLDPESHRRRR